MQIQILYKSKIYKNYNDIKNEYLGRIKNYASIEIVDKFNQSNNNTYFIKINKNSKTISSVEFAQNISNILSSGYSKIFFTFQEEDNCDESISISDMITSENMELILLLEQLYRCFKINNNETYHKWVKALTFVGLSD